MAELEDYEDISDGLRNIIDDVRMLLGDTNDDESWFEGNADAYVSFLRSVVHEVNAAQPFTQFTISSFPISALGYLLHLGLTCRAIEARMNRWVETPRLSGFSGPYADETEFLSRWQQRFNELFPIWRQAKNVGKLKFLPGPAVTVGSMYPPFGGPYQPIPRILRGLPSWYASR